MVARIDFVKSIGDILHYHDQKVEASVAKLLFASGFPGEEAQLVAGTRTAIFNKLTSQNIRSKTNAVHVSLNFIKEDSLSPGKLIQIAGDYMKAIGLGKQPYLVYQHFDAGHPHVHIASVIIKNGGERLYTHNLAYKPSKMAAMAIEQEYGLHPSPSKYSRQEISLETIPLHRVRFGEMPTWRAISSVVGQVTKNYSYGSLPQLNAVLNQFGVMADAGRPDTALRANQGLVYYLLDDNGNRRGRAIKSSDVNGKPTLKKLEKRFLSNKIGRGAYEYRLKHHLDKLLASGSTLAESEAQLRKQGIRIVIQKDPEGKVFGATFIDNGARAVFNDWELGKRYNHKLFLDLEQRQKLQQRQKLEQQRELERISLSEKAGQLGQQRNFQRERQTADGSIPAVPYNGNANVNANSETTADKKQMAAAGCEASLGADSQLYPGSELPVMEIKTDHLYYDDYTPRQSFALSQQLKQEQYQHQGQRFGIQR